MSFEITVEDNECVGTDGSRTIRLQDPSGKMFKRKAFKWNTQGETNVEWLVVSLDGVNVFVRDNDIVVTKENLKP